MKRCLFVGRHDYANVSNRIARAMNKTAGSKVAWVYTLNPHEYGYEEDKVKDPQEIAFGLGDDGWVIWTGDGDYDWFRDFVRGPHASRCRKASQHIGTAYRNNAAEFNRLDAEVVSARFVSCDLLRLATSGPKAVPRFAPYDSLDPVDPVPLRRDEFVRVAHSPTKRKQKGTEAILRALDDLPVEVDVIEGVPFSECIERRGRAHVFVDQLSPDIGAFGQSATEALAQGCAVVSDIRQCEPAWAILPKPPVVQVQDGKGVTAVVSRFANRRDELHCVRMESVAWARRYCSAEAVANWYWSHLE